MAAAHREVQARFVEKHEPLGRNLADVHREVRSFNRDIGPLTLQRPSAFFDDVSILDVLRGDRRSVSTACGLRLGYG
jgi:hypothetical protein